MKFDFIRAIVPPGKAATDSWYNKTVVTVVGSTLPFKTGDKVKLESPLYSGIHTIGYIYKGLSTTLGTVSNLYFKDISFKGDTTGTVEIVTGKTTVPPVIEEEPKESTVQDQVKTPTPGTSTIPVSKATPETVENVADNVVSQAKSLWQNKWIKYLAIGLGIIIVIRILKK